MTKLTVTITAMNKATVVDENGKTFDVEANFHARRVNGTYKYHEVYVFLNKHENFKNEFKAPKTLKQKWQQTGERKFKGPKLIGFTEIIGSTSNRCQYNADELEFDE
jgi:hypothetical protein